MFFRGLGVRFSTTWHTGRRPILFHQTVMTTYPENTLCTLLHTFRICDLFKGRLQTDATKILNERSDFLNRTPDYRVLCQQQLIVLAAQLTL